MRLLRANRALRLQTALPLLALAAAGCATAAHPVVPGPLDAEGEVYVEAQPLEGDAARLSLDLQSITALRADGTEAPLRLLRARVSGADRFTRLIAWGRLDPGTWTGLALQLQKGEVAAPARASALAAGPLRVEGPFKIERQRAVVLQLRIGISRPGEEQAGPAPVPSLALASPPLPVASGYASNTGQHSLAIFDKRGLALAAVLPTGRAPWGVAVDPFRQRIYVALSDRDEVQVFDATLLTPLGSIQLRPGDAPREIALTPDGRALVSANSGSNTASFLDAASMIEVGRVQLDQVPTAVLMDRTGSRAYVSNERGRSVSVLDVPGRALAGSVATEYGPLRVQLNRAGNRIFVATAGSPYLLAYALPGFAPAGRTYVGLGITALKIDPGTDLIYVAQRGTDRLAVYDPMSLLPIDSIEIGGDASYMAIADAENTLFVLLPEQRTIATIDLAGKRRTGQIDTGYDPHVMALSGERN